MWDKIGIALLRRLEDDARQSYPDLGRRVGLSKTPCWHRVQELESEGVIRGFRADLNPQKLGLQVHAFVQATINATKYSEFEGCSDSAVVIH
ncbi:MAG: Lrp/AsnC family transcriptional regulator [Gammaproteobacteria bacterium]